MIVTWHCYCYRTYHWGIDVLMTQTCHSDGGVRLIAGSCWWLTAAHLWQLVSAASWQDRPHMSSIARAEALWAFHASGESQCRVMKEKRPALSTGCWCLWHKQHTFRHTALPRRAGMASCKKSVWACFVRLCLNSTFQFPHKGVAVQWKSSAALLSAGVCSNVEQAVSGG